MIVSPAEQIRREIRRLETDLARAKRLRAEIERGQRQTEDELVRARALLETIEGPAPVKR